MKQTGLRTEYAYDANDRKISMRRSGPDMMTETVTYSYASVDPSDAVPPVDTRPRTVVRTLDGVECGNRGDRPTFRHLGLTGFGHI